MHIYCLRFFLLLCITLSLPLYRFFVYDRKMNEVDVEEKIRYNFSIIFYLLFTSHWRRVSLQLRQSPSRIMRFFVVVVSI